MRALFKGYRNCERIKGTFHDVPGDYNGLVIGAEYYVMCMAGFKDGEVFVLIDDGVVFTPPAVFCELIDNKIPKDWILNILDDNNEANFILGPEVLVKTPEDYDALLDYDYTPELIEYLDSLGDEIIPIFPDPKT